jgi:hypothetical protein
VTPEEAMNQHAVDAAKRLLSEPPKHFLGARTQTYFCFLEMGYAQFPDWAVVHRPGGEIGIGEDLVLLRPDGETTMEAAVLGPLFQLHANEVRLWEAVAMKLHRAFVVVEQG